MGVKVTLQLDVVALILPRVHGLPVKLPVAVPVLVNATVPAGAEFVFGVVFLTKLVQVVDWATTIALREHDTTVVVEILLTVTVLLVPELVVWVVSLTDGV